MVSKARKRALTTDHKSIPYSSHPDFPGAFPQMAHQQSERSGSPVATLGRTTPRSDAQMLKPIFCVYFSVPSSSPIDKIRAETEDFPDSPGSWWSASDTLRRSNTAVHKPKSVRQPLRVEFARAKLALPSVSKRPRPQCSSKNVDPDVSSVSLDSSGHGSDTSTLSGTQIADNHAASNIKKQTFVISGDREDLAPDAVEKGQVAIDGGTFIVHGIRREEECEAMRRILQLIVRTETNKMLRLTVALHDTSHEARAGATRCFQSTS